MGTIVSLCSERFSTRINLLLPGLLCCHALQSSWNGVAFDFSKRNNKEHQLWMPQGTSRHAGHRTHPSQLEVPQRL